MSAPATAPRWLESGDRVGGKYEVLRLIGRGGMGAVYEVAHAVTKKRFALKWMVPELASSDVAVERFVREAQSACALEHPNVVQVFDVDQDGGSMYAVMELLRGEPLSDRIERGPIAAERLVRLLLPMLHGLQEAHERGVIHRDLKPENLFLVRDRPGLPERPKILDFGLSKQLGDGRASQFRLTNTGMVMGTPAYMAPEQALDAAAIDERADIYALGAVMYEALTGQLPFEASSMAALMLKVVQDQPTPPRQLVGTIPPAVEAIVLRCLTKKPADRPASAEALALDLCDALGLRRDLYGPGGVRADVGDIALEPTRKAIELPGEKTKPDVGQLPGEALTSSVEPTTVRLDSAPTGRRRALLVAAVVGLVAGGILVVAFATDEETPASAVPVEVPAPAESATRPESAERRTSDSLAPENGTEAVDETESADESEAEAPPESIATDDEAAGPAPAEEAEPTGGAPTTMRAGRRRTRRMAPSMATIEPSPQRMTVTPRLESGMVEVSDF